MLRRKKVFVNIGPLLLLWSKKLFKPIKIFLRICPFSNLYRKTNFLSISVLLSEIINFFTKKRIFVWISPKCFEKTEKHSLAVCGSFCGEKQFLFIFVQFYSFEQKGLFTTNPIFPLDLLPFKLIEKKKIWLFLSFFLSYFFFD